MTMVFVGVGVGAAVAVRTIVGVGVGDAITVRVGVGVGDGGVVTTAGAMVTGNVFDAVVPAVAVTVTENGPAAVGLPLITPPELIESPAGSPLAEYVIAPEPPVAATLPLYATPTWPPGSEPVEMVNAGALTVIVTVAVAVFLVASVSLTDTVAVAAPAAVGVPLIVSVAPLPTAVSPAGSPVTAAHV